MPNRSIAQSNRAIALAWYKEQELVKQGKGTRDWTLEQQKDIIERGKAYDDDGKAFEGQHMKSVESYPEYQGNPDNIQFLTRDEHFAAHGGSWQNPTNWYYDPITKEKTIFEKCELIPCKVIELCQPIIQQQADESLDTNSQAKCREQPNIPESNSEKQAENNAKTNDLDEDYIERWKAELAKEREQPKISFLDRMVVKIDLLKSKFIQDIVNPDSTLNSCVNSIVSFAVDSCISIEEQGDESTQKTTHRKNESKDNSNPRIDSEASVSEAKKEVGSVSDMANDQVDSEAKESKEIEYPQKRESPNWHMVYPKKPHRYGSEFKAPAPYARGKKKEKSDDYDDTENEDDE